MIELIVPDARVADVVLVLPFGLCFSGELGTDCFAFYSCDDCCYCLLVDDDYLSSVGREEDVVAAVVITVYYNYIIYFSGDSSNYLISGEFSCSRLILLLLFGVVIAVTAVSNPGFSGDSSGDMNRLLTSRCFGVVVVSS